jgi:hypothetical protein
MSPSWHPLGSRAAHELTDARLQLHHGLQIACSTGISCLPKQADDSHTNFGWLAGVDALSTHVVPGRTPFQVALRLASLELLMLDAGARTLSAFPLHGRTVADAYGWLRAQLASVGADPAKLTDRKHYEIPAHPVAAGRAFDASDRSAFAELAAAYHDAALVLEQVRGAHPGAAEVRCWPHHFDIATLIPASAGKTVGAGLSPGDDSYAEPYFYVSPYPYPAMDARAPDLPSGGVWHRSHWFGAVLTATALVAGGDAGGQQARTTACLDAAIRAALAMPG